MPSDLPTLGYLGRTKGSISKRWRWRAPPPPTAGLCTTHNGRARRSPLPPVACVLPRRRPELDDERSHSSALRPRAVHPHIKTPESLRLPSSRAARNGVCHRRVATSPSLLSSRRASRGRTVSVIVLLVRRTALARPPPSSSSSAPARRRTACARERAPRHESEALAAGLAQRPSVKMFLRATNEATTIGAPRRVEPPRHESVTRAPRERHESEASQLSSAALLDSRRNVTARPKSRPSSISRTKTESTHAAANERYLCNARAAAARLCVGFERRRRSTAWRPTHNGRST